MMFKRTAKLVAASAIGLGGTAQAGVAYVESGDAGRTLAGAQVVDVAGSVDSISGHITPSDVDFYKLVFDQAGTVSFTYTGAAGQLTLLNGAGVGLANYRDPGEGSGSIPASFMNVSAGSFLFVGFANGGVDPRDGSNLRLFPTTSLMANAPTNLNPYADSSGTAVIQTSGDYVITFQPNSVSGVPSVGGLGMAGVAATTALGRGRSRRRPH